MDTSDAGYTPSIAQPIKVLKAWMFCIIPASMNAGSQPRTRDIAEKACRQNRWVYSRGDEAEAQRIKRGIWSEISQASAVLIDITGYNSNVTLELGLVHALGRSCHVIAQGAVEEHTFPSLEKVQIYTYVLGLPKLRRNFRPNSDVPRRPETTDRLFRPHLCQLFPEFDFASHLHVSIIKHWIQNVYFP